MERHFCAALCFLLLCVEKKLQSKFPGSNYLLTQMARRNTAHQIFNF